MQAGRWVHDASERTAVRLLIDGRARVARDVTVTSSMMDAHPTVPSTSPTPTLSATVAESSTPLPAAVDPISRPGSWPPSIGQAVEAWVSDGVGPDFLLFRGTVADVSGSATSRVVEVSAVGPSRELEQALVRPAAVAASHPPPGGGGEWRELSLTVEAVVDLAVRGAGFFACAPRVWETRLEVPMMGSVFTSVGVCASAGTPTDVSRGQVATSWGSAMFGVVATYDLTSPATPSQTLELTVDLPGRSSGSGEMYIALTGDIGDGCRVRYNHDTDTIRASAYDNAVAVSLPRGGASRFAVRFSRTGISLMREQDTSAATVAIPAESRAPTTWACTGARVHSPPPVGGFTVSVDPVAWGALRAPRTARIRTSPLAPSWLSVATHGYGQSIADRLQEIAQATCSAFHVDAAGVFQWSTRGALESQAVSGESTSLDALRDLPWSISREMTARSIRVTRDVMAREARGGNRVIFDVRGPTDMRSGDIIEEMVTAPDDEDWLTPDTSVTQLSADNVASRALDGTVYALTRTDDADSDAESWEAFTTARLEEVTHQRSYRWVVVPWTPLGQATQARFPQASTPRHLRGTPGLILRGNAKITWTPQTDEAATATGATIGDVEFEHRGGRWVQGSSFLSMLRAFLKAELAAGWPGLDAVPLRFDPRIEVGDRRVLHDLTATGLRLTVIVQQVTHTIPERGPASTSLSVRIHEWSTTGRDVPPALSWLQTQAASTPFERIG